MMLIIGHKVVFVSTFGVRKFIQTEFGGWFYFIFIYQSIIHISHSIINKIINMNQGTSELNLSKIQIQDDKQQQSQDLICNESNLSINIGQQHLLKQCEDKEHKSQKISSFFTTQQPVECSKFVFSDMYKNDEDKQKYSKNKKYAYFNTLTQLKNNYLTSKDHNKKQIYHELFGQREVENQEDLSNKNKSTNFIQNVNRENYDRRQPSQNKNMASKSQHDPKWSIVGVKKNDIVHVKRLNRNIFKIQKNKTWDKMLPDKSQIGNVNFQLHYNTNQQSARHPVVNNYNLSKRKQSFNPLSLNRMLNDNNNRVSSQNNSRLTSNKNYFLPYNMQSSALLNSNQLRRSNLTQNQHSNPILNRDNKQKEIKLPINKQIRFSNRKKEPTIHHGKKKKSQLVSYLEKVEKQQLFNRSKDTQLPHGLVQKFG